MRNLVAYNPNAVVCEYYAMEHKPSSIQESIIAAITVMCTGVISALSLAKFSTCRTVWLLRHVGSAAALLVALAIGFVGATTMPAAGAQIYVQQSGTSAAGGDPNFVVDLGSFVTGPAGSATYMIPLLIIVAQYNGVGTPTISYSECSTPSACPLATIDTYGLTSNTDTLTSSSTDNVYSLLGLNSSDNSDKWGNLSTGPTGGTDPYTTIDLPTPTSFSLYAFELPVALTSAISIDTTATNGSYIFAYGCQADTTLDQNGQCPNGSNGDTPYTNAGFIYDPPPPGKIPEPPSWALLAAGLLGFAVLRRRTRLVR